jgi:hypothetical protein
MSTVTIEKPESKRPKKEVASSIPENRVTEQLIQIAGVAPISFGRRHETPKLSKDESADAYEQRTFREKTHYDHDTGVVFVPAMALKKAIEEAAKYLSISIPGKGKETYTKNFRAGVMVTEPAYLMVEKPTKEKAEQEKSVPELTNIKLSDGREEAIFVSSQGRSGSGSRVKRYFLTFDNWQLSSRVTVLDGTITQEIFEYVLTQAGKFIGIGRFRPSISGGFYGRFRVVSVKPTVLIG